MDETNEPNKQAGEPANEARPEITLDAALRAVRTARANEESSDAMVMAASRLHGDMQQARYAAEVDLRRVIARLTTP